MIERGEAEVFKRQQTQPLHGLVDPDLAVLDLFQQLSQVLWLNDFALDL